jgi:hypothetical protein
MRSFLFNLGTPGAGETAIATVRLYESANGLTGWALVNSVAVGDLVDDPGGKKLWENALADPAKYATLVPVSAAPASIERPGSVILPPAPLDPDTFTLYAWTVDLGLGIVKGVKMTATPAAGVRYAVAAAKIAVKATSSMSDAFGYVALTLPADAGNVDVAIDGHSVTINTAGRTGQTINLATLL